MSEKYNGWTNYETWNVKLWLDNDQGSYNDMVFAAENAEDVADTLDLADYIREYVEEMMPEMDASMFSDLLGAALSEVNWREIAAAYLEDAED